MILNIVKIYTSMEGSKKTITPLCIKCGALYICRCARLRRMKEEDRNRKRRIREATLWCICSEERSRCIRRPCQTQLYLEEEATAGEVVTREEKPPVDTNKVRNILDTYDPYSSDDDNRSVWI